MQQAEERRLAGWHRAVDTLVSPPPSIWGGREGPRTRNGAHLPLFPTDPSHDALSPGRGLRKESVLVQEGLGAHFLLPILLCWCNMFRMSKTRFPEQLREACRQAGDTGVTHSTWHWGAEQPCWEGFWQKWGASEPGCVSQLPGLSAARGRQAQSPVPTSLLSSSTGGLFGTGKDPETETNSAICTCPQHPGIGDFKSFSVPT